MSLRLLMLVLVYSVFIVIFYMSESKKQILKLNNIQKQIVSGVLFGARSLEQLRQNIQALEVELSAEEKEFLQHG